MQLGMDPGKVARLVGELPAEAWIFHSASREVLEHFISCFSGLRTARYGMLGTDKPAPFLLLCGKPSDS